MRSLRSLLFLFGLVAVGLVPLGLAAADPPIDPLLFRAIRRGDQQLLRNLLQQGTPADVRTADGTTPLMYAAIHGSVHSMQLLLAHRADVNAVNKQQATPLLYSCGNLAKVRLLLDHGAQVNARSELGNTPLLVAAAQGDSTAVVELLLARGADASVRNRRGFTPLRNAIAAGNLETVKRLVDHGALASPAGTDQLDLAAAADRGSLQLVQYLLERGADPNRPTSRTPLHAALLAQQPDIARLLIDRGARLDGRLQPGNVPTSLLAVYTEQADCTVLEALIERGADLNAANEHGETALSWARKRESIRLIRRLVDAGAAEGTRAGKELPSQPIANSEEGRAQQLADSIRRGLSLLQHSSDVFIQNRQNCISCHHQNLPAVALGAARDRGFEVDEDSLRRMIDGQLRSWRPRIERAYQLDHPVPVAPRFIGYGLLGFAALGQPRDEVTDALVSYLAAIQQPDGHWIAGMLRPPLGGGDLVATVLAMRGLQLYPLSGQESRMAGQVDHARQWLRKATPAHHQQRVYKLLGLSWTGTQPDPGAEDLTVLLNEQRADGGWAQLFGMSSDAWATGQALVALRIAGGLDATHPAYRRGMDFLLRTQFEDGSWFVPTRSWPFQTHFDSEFPHGRDQWVSAPATAWALLALVLAAEPPSTVARDLAAARSSASARADIASTEPIDFVKHIQPLLERSCVGCHSGTEPEGGFRITRRALLIRGGDSKLPAVSLGPGQTSRLIRFVSDAVEDLEMPPLTDRDQYPALTGPQIARLERWLEQGAPWPQQIVLSPTSGDLEPPAP